ncbi:DUF2958 domain-containing protein [Stagnihabitans tardus]|uniref:DUF2958 domain-containing protein n=1 Tax=Stagnihabitans tardus TaxID=2699202 RepID=A0AAE5BVI9_9RHOB|nr:DUF2958 domain-containing protein [Stagnihabitans tardus]NBZ88986.1 DUF2958 domain-containing protein [Stagnihabitans tardus]
MKLLAKKQHEQLLENGLAQAAARPRHLDLKPVVRFFDPNGPAVWLATEILPEFPDLAFGLADLGLGCPEVGSFSLAELAAYRGPFMLGIERDRHWSAKLPLSGYAELASRAGRIVEP